VSSPYDHEALWLKAKLFLNRAMDESGDRPFEERALWASLALELLAKAALARVSPLLVAEPTEDGTNLLIASGLVEGDARFTSVRAKTLYARCHKAFKPFSETEAGKITLARNDYLHGSAAGFTSMPEAAWWPRFWTLAVILVSALDRDIDALVGGDRERVVERHLEQNKKNIEDRTEMLIQRARQRLAQFNAGTLPARVAADWTPGTDLRAGLRYSEPGVCPACGGWGTIEGEDSLSVEVRYEQVAEDDYDVMVDVLASSEYFSCPACSLVLDNYQLVAEAGFESSFETVGDSDDIPDDEGEYGND
jgi:hypothetical protein